MLKFRRAGLRARASAAGLQRSAEDGRRGRVPCVTPKPWWAGEIRAGRETRLSLTHISTYVPASSKLCFTALILLQFFPSFASFSSIHPFLGLFLPQCSPSFASISPPILRFLFSPHHFLRQPLIPLTASPLSPPLLRCISS